MILVVAVAIAVLIGLATGGSLRALGALRFRFLPLVFLALIVQVIIFTPIAGETDLIHRIGPWIYVSTIVVLLFVMAMNLQLPGMKLVMLGTFLNGLVIVANGGFMPSPEHALREAGRLDKVLQDEAEIAAGEAYVLSNSKIAGDDAPLLFLGDIFYIPHPWPLHNVFSIGDILIALGAGYAVIVLMRRRVMSGE
ncbi:MAG: hypothetical protein DCC58_14835 [Chloroflexi bacterium]|nr:MAG: hypothetical protein DCC58_14835 [Chloroflexota bacterium]